MNLSCSSFKTFKVRFFLTLWMGICLIILLEYIRKGSIMELSQSIQKYLDEKPQLTNVVQDRFEENRTETTLKRLPLNISWPKLEKRMNTNQDKLPPTIATSNVDKIRKYSRNETFYFIYNHIKKVTKTTSEHYLQPLRETLLKYGLLDTFDINHFKTLNASFPNLFPPELRISYRNLTYKGIPLPIFTQQDNGNVGNKMGEYAGLLAICRLYNVSAYIIPSMNRNLRNIFPYMSLPVLPPPIENYAKWKKVYNAIAGDEVNYSPLELAAAGLMGPDLFIFDATSFEMQHFNYYREEIYKEFRFADPYVKLANEFLHSIKAKKFGNSTKANITFINIHARRGDYIVHITRFSGVLPNRTYFKAALQYYRAKYPNPVFIAASDDRHFMNKTIEGEPDVFLVPDVDGPRTLAILAACNHSIITVGTYGFWAGYLTGGEVVYSGCNCSRPYPISTTTITKARLTHFHSLEYSWH